MPTVALKYVVSFTSQDNNHPIQNIISGDGFRKWLSDPKGKSSCMEAIFQLEKESVISYVDIGSHYCANIEVLVGRSEWPQGRDYQTLISTCELMSVTDSRMGKNVTRTRMFNSDNFVKDVAALNWDRVKVICRQPFRRDVQYGLLFLRIKSSQSVNDNVSQPLMAESRTFTTVPPTEDNAIKNMRKHVLKNLESNGTPSVALKTKLLKIAESSELGSSHTESLTRTAKLVLAAADSAGPFSPSTKVNREEKKFFSQHLDQKNAPQFEDEVSSFVRKLEISEDDLESIKIVDLRHKFERLKKRKLTKEEKKVFIQQIKSCLRDIFSGRNGGDSAVEKSNNNCGKVVSNKNQDRNKASKEICDNNLLSSPVVSGKQDKGLNSSVVKSMNPSSLTYSPPKCVTPRRTLVSQGSISHSSSAMFPSHTEVSSPSVSNNYSSRKRKRHNVEQCEEPVVFCSKCKESIPEQIFSHHYIMCSSSSCESYSQGSSVSMQEVDLTESCSETLTMDTVSCPICDNKFDVRFIEVHANMCLMQLEG